MYKQKLLQVLEIWHKVGFPHPSSYICCTKELCLPKEKIRKKNQTNKQTKKKKLFKFWTDNNSPARAMCFLLGRWLEQLRLQDTEKNTNKKQNKQTKNKSTSFGSETIFWLLYSVHKIINMPKTSDFHFKTIFYFGKHFKFLKKRLGLIKMLLMDPWK